MQDRWKRPDVVGPRALPTSEQATVLYAEFAGEVLKGFPVFDRMEEDAQGKLVADTADVIAGIVFLYGGYYRSTSPDVAWAALRQGYSGKTANESAFGRFRQALGKSDERAYKTAFAMLEAGVKTKADLANLGKTQPDVLAGIRDLLRGDVSVKTRRGISDSVLPLPDELAEL